MSSPSRTSSHLVRNLVAAAILLAVVVAMIADTKFLSPEEAAAVNPPEFNAETYADEAFPKAAAALTEKAVPITELAPAIEANPVAAGQKYGTDMGSGKFAYAVTATGMVESVDADFVLLDVPGLTKDEVRIPLGAAISGTPVRDAPGTITFSDFNGQSDYQSVANQFKLKIESEVISKLEPRSLKGKELTVVGAWSTGGPPNSFIIQPVSVEVAQ